MPDRLDEILNSLGIRAKSPGGVESEEIAAVRRQIYGVRPEGRSQAEAIRGVRESIYGPSPRGTTQVDPDPSSIGHIERANLDYLLAHPEADTAGGPAAGAREALRQRIAERRAPREVSGLPALAEDIGASAVSLADKASFGFLMKGAKAIDPDNAARIEASYERAYEPAKQLYGETPTKIMRGLTEGAASMTTFAPAAGAATQGIKAGLKAVGAGAKAGVAAAPLAFGAVEAGAAALHGEDVIKAGLRGVGFGAVAGLTVKALREGLDLLPATAKRAVLNRILSETGAMVVAGRVVRPGGEWTDDVVNGAFGAMLAKINRSPSRGFQPETKATAPEAARPEPAASEPPVYKATGDPVAAERGFASPTGLASATAKATGRAAVDLKNAAVREFGTMTDRVRTLGTESARETATKAEGAIDTAKRRYGEMSKELDATLVTSGRSQKVASALAKHDFQPGKDYATAAIVEIGEGRASPRNLGEKAVMDSGRAFVMRRGKAFEEAGIKRTNPETGEVEPFVARENVMPRVLHTEGIDVLRAGESSPAWKPLVRGIAEMNGLPVEKVEATLKSRSEQMAKSGQEPVDFESHAEHFRRWQRFPSAVKTETGQVVPILETNPFNYFQGLARSGAARMGVAEAFGQDIGNDRPLASLRERFVTENRGKGVNADEMFTETMRALHNVAVEPPVFQPGTRRAAITRGAAAAGGVVKEAMLTTSTIPNLMEPLGNNASFAGFRTFARETLRQVTGRAKAEKAEVERMGAIDPAILNRTTDPNRIGSGVRAAREVTGRVTGRIQVEQAGGTNAGLVARAVRQRMEARKGTTKQTYAGEVDYGQMRRLGFDAATARRLAYGQATPAEYDAMVRRTPSRLMGENMASAETSRFEQRRLVRAGIAFNRFANMTLRDTVRVLDTTARTMAEAVRTKSWRTGAASMRNLIAHASGKAVSNAASTLALSYILGGETGLEIAWNEAEGNVAKFLTKSLLYGTVSGPYGSVLRVTSGDQDIGDAIFPVVVVGELIDAVQGDGRYRYDDTGLERFGSFVERFAPVHRIGTTGILAFAFGNADDAHKIEVAKRAYWRFMREEVGDQPRDFEVKDSTRKFRKAYEAVLEGDHKRADAFVREALGVGGKNPKASLRARTLLDKPSIKPRLNALKERIGEDAYRLLEAHDRLIRAYAATRG